MLADPIVETAFGEVRGVNAAGVEVFKGVPYGEAERFQPAHAPHAWSGVRDAFDYGPMAIQHFGTSPIYNTIFRGLFAPKSETSEACLSLDIWTPGQTGKRPVMVWLHPGLFHSGAGHSDWCEGERLARRQDVVVVLPNHRLGVFGHLYLAGLGGPAYAESGNLGMLDLVLALEWVRDNIAAFGGDPDNVTIFGEGGGAPKVCTLLAMPAAKGLLHKAIVQSYSYLRTAMPEDALRTTAKVLARLGEPDMDALLALPAQAILAASVSVEAHDLLCPVVAGEALPRHPCDPDAPEVARDVALMVGTTKDELTYFTVSDKPIPVFDELSLRRFLIEKMGLWGVDEEEAAGLVSTYNRLHPRRPPVEVFAGIGTQLFRDDAFLQVERKVAQGGAPAFMYLFTWESPAFEGRFGSCHTFEIPFAFDNLAAATQLFGPDPDHAALQVLADNMSTAWAAFARSGDPSHSGIGRWSPYDLERRPTMVFGLTSGQAFDPLGDDRQAFASFRPSRLAKAAKAHIGWGKRDEIEQSPLRSV